VLRESDACNDWMEPLASIDVVAMELHPIVVARTLAKEDKPDALIVLKEASDNTFSKVVDIFPDTVILFAKDSTPEILTPLVNDVNALLLTVPATRK
jgi:hypothetical protein